MMIDEVDIQILKTLQGLDKVWRGTIIELAEDLHISEETVDNRLKRLEEAGIILYYEISLTPWIYGGHWIWAEASINLQTSSYKDKVIKELKAKLNFFDEATTNTVIPSGSSHDLSVTFHARSEDQYIQEVTKILNIKGVAEVNALMLEQSNVEKVELDDRDWKVLRSLKQDIWEDLSKETDIRPEEIENRIKALIERKKLFFFATIDFQDRKLVSYSR